MEIILKNPYWTKTVYLSGQRQKEQQKQISKLKMYLSADQDIPDELTDTGFKCLGEYKRTSDAVNDATSKLNLDNDRMLAALFWFYNGNKVTDEPAFDALKEYDFNGACSIWEKLILSKEVTSKNASAFSNLATVYLSGILDGTNTNESILKKGITLKTKIP